MKTYSFRVGKEDTKIDALLSKMAASRRSSFIKEAILFYSDVGGELRQIKDQLKNLAIGGIPTSAIAQAHSSEKESDYQEDILTASIENLL